MRWQLGLSTKVRGPSWVGPVLSIVICLGSICLGPLFGNGSSRIDVQGFWSLGITA